MAKSNSNELGDITIKEGPYPELTWTAVLVGWAIGGLIAISIAYAALILGCLLYTSPSPRDRTRSRMPSSA